MKRISITSAILFWPLAMSSMAADTVPSPYAGEESRAVKSLSAEDVAELRRGGGYGMQGTDACTRVSSVKRGLPRQRRGKKSRAARSPGDIRQPASRERPRNAKGDARGDEAKAHEEPCEVRDRGLLQFRERLVEITDNKGSHGSQAVYLVADGAAEGVHGQSMPRHRRGGVRQMDREL